MRCEKNTVEWGRPQMRI